MFFFKWILKLDINLSVLKKSKWLCKKLVISLTVKYMHIGKGYFFVENNSKKKCGKEKKYCKHNFKNGSTLFYAWGFSKLLTLEQHKNNDNVDRDKHRSEISQPTSGKLKLDNNQFECTINFQWRKKKLWPCGK